MEGTQKTNWTYEDIEKQSEIYAATAGCAYGCKASPRLIGKNSDLIYTV